MKKTLHMAQQHPKDSSRLRVLRMKDLIEKLGISRSSIYDMLNPDSPRYDPTFPRSIKLGARSVGWIEDNVDEWLQTRE